MLLWVEEGQEAWCALCADCGMQPFIYLRLVERRAFEPSRRCPAHGAPGVKVREVVRVIDDRTTLALFTAAKAEVDKLKLPFGERTKRFTAIAALRLQESEAGATPAPSDGSGWALLFDWGHVRVCDTCARVSAVLNDPRQSPDWPLTRCRACRKACRRLPSEFAGSLTSNMKRAICRIAAAAVREEEERSGRMTDAQRRDTFTRHARLAMRALHAKFREERGQ
jgi:hypothetical protein